MDFQDQHVTITQHPLHFKNWFSFRRNQGSSVNSNHLVDGWQGKHMNI